MKNLSGKWQGKKKMMIRQKMRCKPRFLNKLDQLNLMKQFIQSVKKVLILAYFAKNFGWILFVLSFVHYELTI